MFAPISTLQSMLRYFDTIWLISWGPSGRTRMPCEHIRQHMWLRVNKANKHLHATVSQGSGALRSIRLALRIRVHILIKQQELQLTLIMRTQPFTLP